MTTAAICNCCGANAWKRPRIPRAIWYLECLECHYWVQRRLGVADLSAQFEAEQRKFYDEDSLLLSPTLSTLTREITDRRISTVLHHLPKGSSIIEAGPGSGDVIRSLADRGYSVSAVEHSPVLAKRLREQGGIAVLVGDFADQQLPERHLRCVLFVSRDRTCHRFQEASGCRPALRTERRIGIYCHAKLARVGATIAIPALA